MDFKWTRWSTHAFFLIQHKLQVAEEKKVPSSLQNKTWINAHGSDVVAITRRPGNYLLGPRSADPAQCPVLSLSGSRGGRRVQASLALKMSNNERTLKEEYILEYQVLWAKESETIGKLNNNICRQPSTSLTTKTMASCQPRTWAMCWGQSKNPSLHPGFVQQGVGHQSNKRGAAGPDDPDRPKCERFPEVARPARYDEQVRSLLQILQLIQSILTQSIPTGSSWRGTTMRR